MQRRIQGKGMGGEGGQPVRLLDNYCFNAIECISTLVVTELEFEQNRGFTYQLKSLH